MAKRDDIVIGFGGDDSRFRRVARRVRRTVDSMTSAFAGLGNTIAGALGFGAGATGAGVAAGVAKLTQELDELGKTAVGLNTTVEELHALRFAVSQTSTITETQLTTALQRLVKHIGQAQRGVKESQKVFAELGLSWEYLASLDSDRAFLEVADAIAQIDDRYSQASVAQKLFEDNWRALLPTLTTARTELEGMMQTARDMPGPTTEAAQQAARLNDQLAIMSELTKGIAYEYGPGVIQFLSYWGQNITGISGLTGLAKIKDEIVRLEQAIGALEGHSDWFSNFWSQFLSDAEKEGTIREMRQELQALYDDYERMRQEIEKRNQQPEQPEEPPASPSDAYHRENLRDFQAYRAGEITRQEWLNRERARNPYTNPDSPYADQFSQTPDYTNPEGNLAAEPQVSADFQLQIQKAVAAAMAGTTYKMRVLPEIVGMEGVETIMQDGVDKEGSNSGL